MVPTQTRELSDLSQVIGELRNFAAQQAVTNTHMLEELKKISDRMASFGEVGATFVEYRKTLHERFGKIHEQMLAIDERCDKLELLTHGLDRTVPSWKGQLRTVTVGGTLVASLLASLLASYGGALLKLLASASPP